MGVDTRAAMNTGSAHYEFIPAYDGSGGRKAAALDNHQHHASGKGPGSGGSVTDLRSSCERVFGNTLFEDDPYGAPSHGHKFHPGGRALSAATGSGYQAPAEQQVQRTAIASPTSHRNSPQYPRRSKHRSPDTANQSDTPERPQSALPPLPLGLAARRMHSLKGQVSSGSNASSTPRSLQAAPPLRTAASGRAFEDTAVTAFTDERGPALGSNAHAAPALVPHTRDCPASGITTWQVQVKHLIASGRRDQAVQLPAAPGQMVRCFVRRHKAMFGTKVTYHLCFEGSGEFLLAARKRRKSRASSYIISLDAHKLKRNTPTCAAKLKANYTGTEYLMWGRQQDGSDGTIGSGRGRPSDGGESDASDSPRGTPHGGVAGDCSAGAYIREDLCVNFKATALSSKAGPRTMFVAVPQPGADGQNLSLDSLSHTMDLARRRELPSYLENRMCMMVTKQPEYSEKLKAFTLDFQGRVTEASVKNFQLVQRDANTGEAAEGPVHLMFGKKGKDVYALDFAHPFNLQQAFAVALASMDSKLCVAI